MNTTMPALAEKPQKKSVSAKSRAKGLWLKPCFFLLALVPFIALVWSVVTGSAGPNPIESIEKQTGEWSLRFLLLSLAMTPISQLFKVLWPVRIRRMTGLFAFFYVFMHFLAYFALDQSFNLTDIVADVIEKPFITVGFVGFLILIPLAVTSNKYMVRKLKSRWKSLHKWAYIAGVAGVVHYVWLAKGEILDPIVYLVILIALLGYRLAKVIAFKT